MNKDLESIYKLLSKYDDLTDDEKMEEYYFDCLEVTDECNYYENPVPIIKFSNKNWSYKYDS